MYNHIIIKYGGIKKMEKRVLDEKMIGEFRKYLISEEKSENTVKKYCRDALKFAEYAGGKELTKEDAIEYKNKMKTSGSAVRSVNSVIASLNSLFVFLDWHDMKLKMIKIQQQIFRAEEKELSRAEYERLVYTALTDNEDRLSLMIQTICGTGIRVSELQFITVEAARRGYATVDCKGKTREVFIVCALQNKLLLYAAEHGIKTGSIFITKYGNPVDRSNVWRGMKSLCIKAGVSPEKVFPHNLRHLFARVFYDIDNDLARLADILGHSSINTTRIYIMSTGSEHRRCMENMHLII